MIRSEQGCGSSKALHVHVRRALGACWQLCGTAALSSHGHAEGKCKLLGKQPNLSSKNLFHVKKDFALQS